MSPSRHLSLDALRGFAVMGILVMNIIAFAMPMSAYTNPMAFGTNGFADLFAWGAAFVLIDGKMRGLFSLLFGASLLLVIDRADTRGQNAAQIHYRRMGWLLILGLCHAWFIWDGDILALYALCGMAAYLLRHMAPKQLVLTGSLLMLCNLLIWCVILLTAHALRQDALLANTDAARATYAEMADALGAPEGASIAKDLQNHHAGYLALTKERLGTFVSGPLEFFFGYGLETMGLMAWGMALFKSGALTGQWSRRKLMSKALIAYGLGLPASLALALFAYRSGFETLVTADIYFALNTPARMAVMLGHIFALTALIGAANASDPWLARVAAAGRMAFSNYILTSLLMTTLFYGYGFGLYGQVSRAQAYLAVPFVWAVMLIWSPMWLRHFAYGPLEWLWRSLARGSRQPFRLSSS
jgi:uncharacterized protein